MNAPTLLVSVRDAGEAVAAVAGGAGIIDIKDPAAGSLGMAAAETLVDCGRVVPAGCLWTLAGGELREAELAVERLAAVVPHCPRPPAAVKFGLSEAVDSDWPVRLAAVRERLPEKITVVPVAYADTASAAAPPVAIVIEAAARSGCPLVLVDTFDKQGSGSLLSLATLQELADWIRVATRLGLGLVLAGKIPPEDIATVAGCRPLAVAVRSAVCVGGRLGRIDQQLVQTAVAACRTAGSGVTPAGGSTWFAEALSRGS